MGRRIRQNWRKATWAAQLNEDIDGRGGVTSYAGHADVHGIGLHVSLDRDPSRPVAVSIFPEDMPALRKLLATYDAASEAAEKVLCCNCGREVSEPNTYTVIDFRKDKMCRRCVSTYDWTDWTSVGLTFTRHGSTFTEAQA